MLTIFDDDDKIFEAIKAGASGYLLKDENAEALYNAITSIMIYGGAPMSAAIARKAMDLLSKASLPKSPGNKAAMPLLQCCRKEKRRYFSIQLQGTMPNALQILQA